MGPFSSSGSATTVTAGEVFSNLPNLTVANASNNFYDSDASQWGYINTLLKAFYNDVPAMGYTISQAQTTVNRIAGLAEPRQDSFHTTTVILMEQSLQLMAALISYPQFLNL